MCNRVDIEPTLGAGPIEVPAKVLEELYTDLRRCRTRCDGKPATVLGVHGYPGDVTSANAYELPPHTSPPAEAVDAAEHGQVVYLTRGGQPVAAIVPAAAIEALEDSEDVRAADAALAEPGPDIPMSEVWAEYADILGSYPGR